MSDLVKMKRTDLYEKMWEKPITDISKEFSISYKSLVTACDTYDIPRPSKSYWSLKNRQREAKIPLSTGEDKIITFFKVRPSNKPHTSHLTPRANTVCILRILELKTDINHGLSTNDIIDAVYRAYGMTIERRTVYSAIRILQDLGYNIISEDYKYKLLLSNRDMLQDRMFDADEVQALLDSIKLNPLLPADEERSLYYKTKRLMPKHNCATLHNVVSEVSKKDISAVFYGNINEINIAMFSNKKIAFDYMKYDSNGKPTKMYDNTFTLSPVRYQTREFTSYLICADDDKKLYKFRVDRMYNLEALEDKRIDVHNLNSIPLNMDDTEYTARNCKFSMTCDSSFATEVVDYFGPNAKLRDNADGTFTVVHTANQNRVLTFAYNNPDKCEIIEPLELRNAVINKLKNNKYGV